MLKWVTYNKQVWHMKYWKTNSRIKRVDENTCQKGHSLTNLRKAWKWPQHRMQWGLKTKNPHPLVPDNQGSLSSAYLAGPPLPDGDTILVCGELYPASLLLTLVMIYFIPTHDVYECFACTSYSLEMELETVVSCLMGAGNWTIVLWKISQCS